MMRGKVMFLTLDQLAAMFEPRGFHAWCRREVETINAALLDGIPEREQLILAYWDAKPPLSRMLDLRDWLYELGEILWLGDTLWKHYPRWAIRYTREYIDLADPTFGVGFDHGNTWFQMEYFTLNVIMSYCWNAPTEVTPDQVGLDNLSQLNWLGAAERHSVAIELRKREQ